VVNEVMDEGAKLRKLTKELNALKEKQKDLRVGEAEYAQLEAEKNALLQRVFAMENERNAQQAQLERLKNLIATGATADNSLSGSISGDRKRRRKKHRETWFVSCYLSPIHVFVFICIPSFIHSGALAMAASTIYLPILLMKRTKLLIRSIHS
jgi:hypothetical protein